MIMSKGSKLPCAHDLVSFTEWGFAREPQVTTQPFRPNESQASEDGRPRCVVRTSENIKKITL